MDELTALEQAIAALEAQRGSLGDAVTDTALAPLEEKLRRLQEAPPGEQRKQVTVLFADVVDFTVLTGRLDPEDLREVMDRYFTAWRRVIEDEGGVVEKYIGDAVVAVFGLARAREDDPHRAVRAALALRTDLDDLNRRLLRDYGVELAMRVGIDTGEVVISTLGERGDGDYVVVGDRVNRAARIQAAAPPGGILVSVDTGRHVRGSFGLQLVSGLDLKGFPDPVDAFLVVSGEVQSFWLETRGIEGVTTRTVGRDLELGMLRKLFADVVDDRSPLLVTVLGDPGIGKTRLVRDFEEHLAGLAEGVWLLRGRAAPSTEHSANSLLRSVFAERLGIRGGDPSDTLAEKWRAGITGYVDDESAADDLAAWLGFPVVAGSPRHLEPETLQRKARTTVEGLLTRLAARAPVVVLLEDLHWADAASLDWLQQFAPAGVPLLIVATARPTLLERRPLWGEGLAHHTAIRLGGLSRRETRDLVGQILEGSTVVPEDLRETLVEASEGNAYFVEELVKWLLDTGVLVRGADGWTAVGAAGDLEVPGTLRGVLQARLDGLDRRRRSVVDRASVVGRVFWDAAVDALGGDGPAVPHEEYEQLRVHEIVFARPTSTFEGVEEYSFRHSLLRDVAYENVLRSVRRQYHALAAHWLERAVAAGNRADEHAAAVAAHHREAGDHAAAAEWYLRAGRHAAVSFANEDAARLLRAAAELGAGAGVALRFDVLMELEGVLDRTGARDEQRAVLDELGAIAGLDPTRRARLLLCEGKWRFYHGEYAAVPAVVDPAIELAREGGAVELELEAMALAAKSLAFRNEHEPAREMAGELVARAEAAGEQRQLGEGLRLLGVVATNLAQTEEAVALLNQARAVHHALGDIEGEALVSGQLGAVYIQMGGHLDEARSASEEALAMFVSIGHRLRQAIVQGNLVAIALEQGRFDDALALGLENLAITTEVEDTEGIVSAHSRLGEVLPHLGRYDEARAALQQAVELGAEYELDYFVTFSYAVMADIDLIEGAAAAALEHAVAAGEAAGRAEVPHAEAVAAQVAGRAYRCSGDLAAAEDRLRHAAAVFRQVGREEEAGWAEASLAGVVLETGDRDEARRLATASLELARSGSFTAGIGIVPLLELHRVLTALDDVAAGADVAAAARRFLDERATKVADPEARAAMLAAPPYRALAEIAG